MNDLHSVSVPDDVGLHELITAIDPSSETGFSPIDKLEAHLSDIPHTAISIFVLNCDKLLLQRRAVSKYHSGGLWANTVCSHPRWQESAQDCAVRRMQEELGWVTPLTEFAQLKYAARVGELYENEHVHCFNGYLDAEIDTNAFNPLEVMELQWLSLTEIQTEIQRQPDIFSAWFKIYMQRHFQLIEKLVL